MKLDITATDQLSKDWGRDISKYKYWGPRLRVINETFKDSSPNTVNQWRKDRRNGPQRWTVALAILALLMSIIQGILQVIAAFLSWSEARSSSKSV